ncbi:MAG TPA: universal stress protein [Nitrosopumilus sp.]|jgi:nucleotide-binding universal stress UspA family protein|nr:universal stress protein [Nitrosopumilus sp.]HJM26312.1 universal stress protein [Nitrosopumilus sp.]HJO31961.1 universal stress protein [Nitrosopumilus sp.]|tara:strand:+ start:7246 stop:7677 length:432 start_codon:yes stop_codon:yes gene_type:complete
MIKKEISKILVPLDGSKNSVRGMEMAITLAKQCGATITGVYSIYAPPHSEFRGVGSVEKVFNSKIKEFMGDAKTLVEKNGIKFKERLMRGDIGYNIVKFAHGKEKFDMIVMGSRGRSSTKEVFFGSVSNYVIHTSKIPVLIVK